MQTKADPRKMHFKNCVRKFTYTPKYVRDNVPTDQHSTGLPNVLFNAVALNSHCVVGNVV